MKPRTPASWRAALAGALALVTLAPADAEEETRTTAAVYDSAGQLVREIA